MNDPPISTQRDDGACRALLEALVDARIYFGHELLEVGLCRDYLLVHRIALDGLQGAVVLLDLFLRGFLSRLRAPLELLSQLLNLGEVLLQLGVFLHPVGGSQEHPVLVALAQEAAKLLCLVVNHASSLEKTSA